MEVDGMNPVNLTTADTSHDSAPAVSHDGTKIAFRSSRDGNFEIYAMDADGSNPRRLTKNLASDLQPDWQAKP